MIPPVVVAPHGPASALATEPELDPDDEANPELDPDPEPERPELDPEPGLLKPELEPDPELPKPDPDPEPPNPELEPEPPELALPVPDPNEGDPEDDEAPPPSANPGLPLPFEHPPHIGMTPPRAIATKSHRELQLFTDIAETPCASEFEKAFSACGQVSLVWSSAAAGRSSQFLGASLLATRRVANCPLGLFAYPLQLG